MIDRIAPRFARYEPLRHAAELMTGMVSGLDRKNCWTIAEHRGNATPDGLQHLLSRAKWDADAVRDDLRDYVIDAFGDPDATLILDETGDLKKGVHSVGVQRQYTGTAGRIENSQVAVYLTYAAPRGHALIDRALYLPRSWAEAPDRCEAAGIPSRQTGFRDQARTGHGADRPRRSSRRARGVGRRRRGLRRRPDAACRDPRPPVGLRAGDRGQPVCAHPGRHRSASIAPGDAAQPSLAETLRRCRQPRTALYSWAWIRAATPRTTPTPAAPFADPPQRQHRRTRLPALLQPTAGHRCAPWSPSPANAGASRNPSRPPKASPDSTSTKSAAGPPGTAGPPWPCSPTPSWPWPPPPNATPHPTPAGLITLTVNEFRRLFDALLLAANHTINSLLAWSTWRRQHQHRARQSHYRRREQPMITNYGCSTMSFSGEIQNLPNP